MAAAQLEIRRAGPEAFTLSFVPPRASAAAWRPTYTVRLAAADLDELAAAIEQAAGSFVGAGSTSLPETLATLGRLLTRCLLPEPIRLALLRLPPDNPLLIVTDCAAYPWELLYLEDDLLFLQRPVGRQLLGPAASAEPWDTPPVQPALLLIANPTGDLEASDAEAGQIIDIVDALPFYVPTTAIFRAQAGRTAVLAELASGTYSLVHYSGHADVDENAGREPSLRLADGLLEATRLGSALAGQPLVFLNACASARVQAGDSLAVALLRAGARACVGAFWPVSDLASAELSAAFYQALFRGQPVGEALLRARRAVRAVRPADPSWAAFVLYGDPGWRPVPQPLRASYLATTLAARFEMDTEGPYAEDGAQAWGEGLQALASGVLRFGGHVWDLGLSGLLATFGVPGLEEDQAERAAQAALALQETAARLRLELGVGLETDIVVIEPVSALGGRELLLGPAVAVALQLSREVSGNRVLAGPGLRRLLGRRGEWAAAEGGADVLAGLRAEPALAQDVPLIGRDDELAALRGYWQRCCERRQRQIVGLVGEAGIGKTRLLAAFRQEIGANTEHPVARWLDGSCPSYLRGEPFSLLRALLRVGLGLAEDAPPNVWRAALTRAVGDELDLTTLEQVLGIQAHLPEPRDVAEATRRALLVSLLKEFVTRAAANSPIVIAIDDAQQADEESLDVLTQLMDGVENLPILWLALYRREWLPPWANRRRSHTIDLDELAPTDRVRLLNALLPAGWEASTHSAILARAEGNPLYLEELARVVSEGGEVAVLPGTLRLTILARAAGLSPATRNVLNLAAVAGGRFAPATLDAALSQSGEAATLEPALRALVGRDFLRPVDQGYAFRHPLLEEVIYAGLPDPQRQTWHRRLADAMLDRGDVSPAILAYHRWRSVAAPDEHGVWAVHPPPFGPDYPVQAVWALVAAGEAARSQHANREAVRWFELGQKILDRLLPGARDAQASCHAGAGRAFSRLGEFDAAIVHLQAALDLRPSQPKTGGDVVESADLARLIGRLRMRQGQYAVALEWMDRARALVEGREESAAQALLALVQVHTGAVHHWRGDTEQAIAYYRAGIALAERRGGDPIPALAEAYNGLGVALRGQGQLDAAQACYERALSIWQALGESYEAARVQDNLGTVHFYRDDWETARQCYERSLAFWERIEERHNIPYSLLNLGSIHLNQGRWAEAHRCYTRALELWEAVAEARLPALAHVNLAHLALAQGELDTARAHLIRALEVLDQQGVDSFRSEAYATYTELHLQGNDLQATLIWGKRAVETARKLAEPLEEGIAHRLLGQAHHRLQALPEAVDQLQHSCELLASASNRLELARTWVALAAVERDLGRVEEAQAHLDQAIAVFQALGAQPDLLRARSSRDCGTRA